MKSMAAAILSLLIFLGVSANGQADLSFSGGNGSPITMTLNMSVSYTITANAGTAPIFIFEDVGNIFGGAAATVTGTITYTINGGSPFSLDYMNSGVTVGSVTPNDVYVASNSFPGVSIGDVVVLNLGSLTTTSNVAAAPPSNGLYSTFISDGSGDQISTAGVAIPEPATSALLLGFGGLAYVARRIRR